MAYRKTTYDKSISSTHPHLLKEWDYDKNNGINPEEISRGSNAKIWWKCKSCSHEWEVRMRYRGLRGSGCPKCNRSKHPPISISYKHLLEEWDYDKNEVNPNSSYPYSKKKVWWICKECKHRWKQTIKIRAIGKGKDKPHGCPQCAYKKHKFDINKHLELKQYFDTDNFRKFECLNKNDRVSWFCRKCNHKWKSTVTRQIKRSGCPHCIAWEAYDELINRPPT